MNATQHLMPLSYLPEGEDQPWLEGRGLRRPPGWQTSRNPTVRELRQVVSSLVGYDVWDNLDHGEPIWIGSATEGTSVFVKGYLPERNEDDPKEIYFDGTATLEVKIVERLAHLYGPFLLAEEQYIIVEIGTSPETPWLYWP